VDQRPQSLARLEARHSRLGDPNGFASLRIYPIASGPGADAEGPKASDGHTLASGQIAFDRIDQNIHGLRGGFFGHIGFTGDQFNYLRLIHFTSLG